MINLKEYTINPQHVVAIKWPSDNVPTETMPEGTMELANPNTIPAVKVVTVTLAVVQNGTPLSLIFDENSDDYATLKEVFGRK